MVRYLITINFVSMNNLDAITMSGYKIECRFCKEMTGLNKENIRISDDSGKFVGRTEK